MKSTIQIHFIFLLLLLLLFRSNRQTALIELTENLPHSYKDPFYIKLTLHQQSPGMKEWFHHSVSCVWVTWLDFCDDGIQLRHSVQNTCPTFWTNKKTKTKQRFWKWSWQDGWFVIYFSVMPILLSNDFLMYLWLLFVT